jgi:hypothetical protein
MLAMHPNQAAIVLVALALIDDRPEKMRAGKIIKPPPPATAFNGPVMTAARNKKQACTNVINFYQLGSSNQQVLQL